MEANQRPASDAAPHYYVRSYSGIEEFAARLGSLPPGVRLHSFSVGVLGDIVAVFEVEK